VRAGDLVEASATLVRVGSRSRELDFALVVVARGDETIPAAAEMLPEPIVATTATGTVVVPLSQ
jgi:3-aminobutyryl-CoA ammonia-lyase